MFTIIVFMFIIETVDIICVSNKGGLVNGDNYDEEPNQLWIEMISCAI